ncbi:MSHA biogenesis protein MshO [Pseudoduganella lurida]|uniref:MSHA biogenesis protein MshO n=1 Tax=Pseudoduganella lurida TaxID=1036180 RepID=A0A562RK60_9BURK|nr:prepilin-type N-terminal cleavage/methylation domain-containing protein [Pseudoduganella lurida]TWI69445.1 MSHA biogenesis protein MshO [Pseudoduganella lurida]
MPTGAGRGFTLVEAIIVIAITGIIAGMVAIFIRVPVKSYVDTQARAQIADAADLALRRMTREMRLALPATVTVYNNQLAVQFLLTKTGGRYISINDGPPATLLPLDFTSGKTQFDIVGAAPTGKQAIVAGDYIAIGNLGIAPADAYAFGAGADNISRVASIAGSRVTLAQNYFSSTQSTGGGFQVVTGTVTYLCTPATSGAGTLQRYFTTSIVKGIGNLNTLGTPALLTNMVAGCTFSYTVLPGQNAGALATLVLTLRHANGESARLVRQTQLDNPT